MEARPAGNSEYDDFDSKNQPDFLQLHRSDSHHNLCRRMKEELWDEARIERMISDGIEEDLHLDYKAAGSLAKLPTKRDEIVKDVTAFANSDGGVIIYGVREFSGHEKSHRPEKIDPIVRADISKEWLEQVISNASPRISNIRIHPVTVAADPTKCLYVVEIPKGNTAHQANDGRYYRRYNFESVFMRDYEVRDLMNRNRNPELEVEAYLAIRNSWEESGLIFKVKNVGDRIARNYALVVRLPPMLDGALVEPKGDFSFEREDEGSYFLCSLGNGGFGTPLFPKATIHLKVEIRTDVARVETMDGKPLNSIPRIEIKVYADEMEPLLLEIDPALIRGQWGSPLSADGLAEEEESA